MRCDARTIHHSKSIRSIRLVVATPDADVPYPCRSDSESESSRRIKTELLVQVIRPGGGGEGDSPGERKCDSESWRDGPEERDSAGREREIPRDGAAQPLVQVGAPENGGLQRFILSGRGGVKCIDGVWRARKWRLGGGGGAPKHKAQGAV